MQALKLGILDFGYRSKSDSASVILNDVIGVAQLADQLGYSCLWLSEHHNSGPAWSNPEMLLPVLAGLTDRIHIGIAGILLATHSPYRVALNFKLLSTIYPGRIDLGLANGATMVPVVQKLLSNPNVDETYMRCFHNKSMELLRYLQNERQVYEEEKLLVPPVGGPIPRIWKLSTSLKGLNECIEKKMNLCLSTFHSGYATKPDKQQILQFKKDYFKKNKIKPEISIAFASVCEAQTKSAIKTFESLQLNDGMQQSKYIVGSPGLIKEKLHAIYEETGISEFVFHDSSINYAKRTKALELLAKEFELS
jgi:luciferase family oxidoreductase group 1